MIDKLTKKQKSKIKEYYEKWRAIGHEYKKTNRDAAKKAITEYVSIIGIKPKHFLFFDSPLSCQLAINILNFSSELYGKLDSELRSELNAELNDELYDKLNNKLSNELSSELYNELYNKLSTELYNELDRELNNELYSELDDKLSTELRSELSSKLNAELNAELNDKLCSELYNELYNKLFTKLYSELHNELNDELRSELSIKLSTELHNELNSKLEYYSINWWTQSGNSLSGYCAFYDYIESEVVQLENKKTKKIWENFKKVHELHYIFIFEDIVFISEKPLYLKFDRKNLHSEDSPAVLYKDGFSIYSLNGVTVDEYIVMTSPENIDCNIILKEKNAEVRKEIIKKVGIDRVVRELGAKSIEKNEVYELLNFDIIDDTFRPYLKMLNPSTGDFHVEGVHPDCDTIEKALAWRDGETIYERPSVLT